MIRDERPDIMVIGRESFALHVPDLARTHGIPSILGIRGNTAIAILNQTYPESAAREMLQQFAKATLLVSAARHMTEGLKALGFNAITTIPNAIDLNQFQPKPKDDSLRQALNLRAGDTIVAHVSNLKTVKRPLDIVHSAEQALARNDRLAYVIVGDGAHRGAMEDCCRKKRISERFRFVGWVQYPRIPDYINLADMVVMPSASEGLSRVYLESQACERLLLASDIPPAREVIADGETGLLFKMGDCGDLAAKTLLAAADPKLRADIARNARQRVQTHSLDAAVAAYLALFEDLVRRPR
jgi:glycosyltransferase involved in cell wall biosynthesis